MEAMTTQSCEAFLEALSTKAAVPGGGGASALVGAVGVALGNMVGSLTVGKKKYVAVEEEMQRLNRESAALRARLEELVTADAEAFAPLSKAYGLPASTPEEQAHKAAVMEEALDRACAVPMDIMRACCKAISLIEVYAAKGSVMAVSDAGVAAACCKAALQGASLNVFINTRSMAGKDKADRLNREAEEMLATWCPRADKVFQDVMGRLK